MPPRFDFIAFIHQLMPLPPAEMRARAENELLDISGSSTREPGIEFQRALYARGLRRLLGFLQSGRIPPDATPKERTAYQKLNDQLKNGRALAPAVS